MNRLLSAVMSFLLFALLATCCARIAAASNGGCKRSCASMFKR